MKDNNEHINTGNASLDELLKRATSEATAENTTDTAIEDENSATATKKIPSAEEQIHNEREERARQAFKQLVDIDDGSNISLRSILGGDILGGKTFRKQIWFLLMLTIMAIIYVSNRYACQREEIRRVDLSKELIDKQFKALTISSELTEFSMRSNVEENLVDTTLQISTSSSYYLTADTLQTP